MKTNIIATATKAIGDKYEEWRRSCIIDKKYRKKYKVFESDILCGEIRAGVMMGNVTYGDYHILHDVCHVLYWSRSGEAHTIYSTSVVNSQGDVRIVEIVEANGLAYVFVASENSVNKHSPSGEIDVLSYKNIVLSDHNIEGDIYIVPADTVLDDNGPIDGELETFVDDWMRSSFASAMIKGLAGSYDVSCQ